MYPVCEVAPDATLTHTHRRALRSEIEAALVRPGLAVRLAAGLEHLYRIDMASARAADLRHKAAVCAALYVLLAPPLQLAVAAQATLSHTILEICIPPAVALLVAAASFRQEAADWLREAAALVCSLIYTLAVLRTVALDAPHAVHYLVWVSLPVSFTLMFVHLRLHHAMVFVAVSLAALAGCLAVRYDLPVNDRFLPEGFLAFFCLPSLFGVRAREHATRRIYLHNLLQRLRIDHLSAENEKLARLSTTDPLTGVANRRRLDHDLGAFCAGPSPHGALLLIDLDGFKSFNDRHGHVEGDACLRQLAACMAGQLRRCDLLARFGGDEFAVLLPDIRPHEALAAAERLRQAVQTTHPPLGVTISIGVAGVADGSAPDALLTAADRALYAAKRAGRNRVFAAWVECAD